MAAAYAILKSALFVTPPVPTASFENQCIVVTGANRGLGLESCRWFVRLGAQKVIMAVRNTSSGETAKQDITNTEKCNPDIIEVWPLDLASFDSVKAFGKRLKGLKRLDVLLCNAAITTYEFRVVEGHESQTATNVIATFLVAFAALPKLKQTAADFGSKPHVSIVTSDLHHLTNLPERQNASIFEALRDKASANMSTRYSVTKLIEILVVRELFRQDGGPIKDKEAYPVVINTVNPGACHTHLTDELGWMPSVVKFFLARSAEVGSRNFVHAAAAGDESKGQYLNDCKVEEPSAFVRSEEGEKTQIRVWTELKAILEEIEPGVTGSI
ncbi:uncharacterized protein HMPREF1541_00847 [Cyphellophora europaea CBS 101466]|uniref:Uncharacterized protein n=1 Tax=Cyphellophora europaea (strain CBS 101466) TaxID=1220924 RepID=W2SD59_CYPE1|nr:uncharacterized protein HMPREF1541_00847 [Cyphellophora europaea CBS 101466]ETN46661.1 hypothetical protein HMPREF1541_00847 [Cyphellophora europaea CBS 101466]